MAGLIDQVSGLIGCFIAIFLFYVTGRIWCSKLQGSYGVASSITLGMTSYVATALIVRPLGVPLLWWIVTWIVITVALGCRASNLKLREPIRILISQLRTLPFIIHLILAIGILTRLITFSQTLLNLADDDMAYMGLIQKLLYQSDHFDPFCFRSMASYGGQLILQAIPSLFSKIYGYQSFEILICYFTITIGIFELISSTIKIEAKDRNTPGGYLFLLFSLLAIPNINNASQQSAICFLLLVVDICKHQEKTERLTKRFNWELVLCLVAFSSLRNTFVVFSTFFILIEFIIFSNGEDIRKRFFNGFLFAILLLPIALDYYQSFNTPLFPGINASTIDHQLYTFDRSISRGAYFRDVLLNACLPGLLITVIYLRKNLNKRLIVIFLSYSCLVFAAAASNTQIRAVDIFRYNHPFIFILTLIGLLEIFSKIHKSDSQLHLLSGKNAYLNLTIMALLQTCLLISVIDTIGPPGKLHDLKKINLPGLELSVQDRYTQQQSYKELIREIPKDSKIISAIPFPYFLPFAKLKITLIDIPGLTSPHSEFRNLRDFNQTITELRENGYNYIIAQNFKYAGGYGLYSEVYWESMWRLNWYNDMKFLVQWRKRFEDWGFFINEASQRLPSQKTNTGILLIDLNLSSSVRPVL
jgi:hypothetical protein